MKKNLVKKLILSGAIIFTFINPVFAGENNETVPEPSVDTLVSESAPLDKLHVYGWASQNFLLSGKKGEKNIFPLDQHRLNLITIYNINDNFQIFSEIEYEHFLAREGMGDIILERLLFEYTLSDSFSLHIGKFDLPFGFWNSQNDASVNYLSVNTPSSIYREEEDKDPFFAENGSGLWISGSPSFGNINFQYNLYGIQTKSFETTDTNSKENPNNPFISGKGAGGSLFVSPLEGVNLGGSFYLGENNFADDHRILNTAGLSANLEFGNFEGWSEIVFSRTQMDKKNELKNSLGYYVWLSYKTGFNITPYFIYNMLDPNLSVNKDSTHDLSFGLNYLLIPQICLKAETHMIIPEESKDNYFLFAGQIAAAF